MTTDKNKDESSNAVSAASSVDLSAAVAQNVEKVKESGNKEFKNGNYQEAIKLYQQCISQLPQATQTSEKKNEESNDDALKQLRLSCLKNCAACGLKLKQWEEVVEFASEALELSPQDAKALFRRCQAYEKLELWKDAFADVKLLLRIETKDPAVQDLARRINAKVTQINDAQHTTSNLVDDMLSALENSSTPQDKVQKACNNLMILSNESGGSSVLLEKDNLNRLVLLLDKKAPSHAKTVADIYSVLGHLCKTELIANKVKSAVKIERISKGIGSHDESISDACTRFCQSYLDALLNIDPDVDRSQFQYKGDKEKFKSLCLDLNDLLVAPGISSVGRDNCIKLLLRNFLRRSGCGLMLLLMKNAVISRLLKLVVKDGSLATTVNTQLHVSMFLHKFFEDLQSDGERNTFKEYIEAFIKPLFDENSKLDDKCKGMLCLIALLQGPREVGTEMIGLLNAVDIMLELAQSSDIDKQKVALDCIIQASVKASVGTSVLQGGVEVLQQLFLSDDKEVRAKALVGLCKTGSAGGSDKSSKVLDNESMLGLAEECRMLMQSDDNFLIRCGVDGIAFLSLDADVKEDLVGDPEALQGLYKVSKLDDQTILHSVAHILVNLTNSFDKPQKDPELEKLAQFAKYHIPEEHPYDSEEYVNARINKLVETGVIEALVNAHKSESEATKESFSRVFLSISKEVNHRGKLAQQGGAKCLLELSKSGSKKGQLFAAQALARIAISLNPDQAFPGQRMYELIRPLVKLLHIDCSALENFEALLALTNITHVSASVVDKIVKDKHLEKIEHYMYEDHDMLRKAAVECMVNIVHHSAEVREKFCQADNERVKLWTLYCGEWEDNPDLALAAAGGLAILTEYSPQVCNKIMAVSSWMTILKEMLVNDNGELVRRAVHIVNNIVHSGNVEAAEEIADTEILEIFMALSIAPVTENTSIREVCEATLKKLEELKFIEAAKKEGCD